MKTTLKICTFVISTIILSIGLKPAYIQTPGKMAHAQEIITCETSQDCKDEMAICLDGKCVDMLTGRPIEKETPTEAARIVQQLPQITLEQAIATTIQTILGWAMLITIIAIVVAAIYYLKAQGKDEDLTKAKSIIIYLIIGMAIMAAAYGIVTGIAEFDFFRGESTTN